ncbi:MazG nucleotide pyrophosphohydrolase domain-containing protein [Natribaculum luteum]|uniref:MazG nucleotide pyrophosphohydrolase domain-containing protein n=1 Tax=Natribaculum luteum TaxID=1586232 RepID=A0ABD5NWL1_9EURY|nr:MazG nucleotide pyrophosphohydrolase domain-containing protein [Natribaculum luteum]
MDEQRKVAAFVREHELEAPPAYRLLDLVSEVGEVAKDATESTDYGESPTDLEIRSDEIGDVLFALLALADAVEIDASDALDDALEKYDERIAESDTASSGN